MRNYTYLKNLAVGSMFGVAVLVGTALTANAQSQNEEYREWQRAQARAQQEQMEYNRTRSPRDYRQWQNAQRRAQQEYREYQQMNSRYNNGYNNGYNSNRYNNGYNNGYNSNNGRYRVYRNGTYYTTDSRGAELLRSAVQNGYSQGYSQGQVDRQYRRGSSYGNSTLYRSGDYGYQSHVARNQYQYYFQQGFQRGYEDGYNSTYRYGTRSGNGLSILGNVLNTILSFTNN